MGWLDFGILGHGKRISAIEERMEALDELIEEEKAERSARLSAQGSKGVQIREENRAMRAAAMDEGRTIISGEGTLDEKKAKLIQLALKYPKVADEVASALIREFHLEAYEGIIKTALAGALSGQLHPEAPKKELWYGIEV